MFRDIVEALRVVAAFSEGRGEGCVWRASKDLIFFIESRAERNVTSPSPQTRPKNDATAKVHSPLPQTSLQTHPQSSLQTNPQTSLQTHPQSSLQTVHRQFHRQFHREFHRQFHREFHRPGPQTKPKNDSTASSFLIFF